MTQFSRYRSSLQRRAVTARKKSPAIRRFEGRFGSLPAFVVTGTGRCGTQYIAELFRLCGVSCGHEMVYRREGVFPRVGCRGESSWYAAAYLDDFDGVVLHQVRDPLQTISSLASRQMWEPGSAIATFVEDFVELGGDPVEDAIAFYVGWNLLCEKNAQYRYQVERIDDELSILLGKVAPRRAHLAPEVLPRLSKRINSRPRRVTYQSYEQLPGGLARDELLKMAARYGYTTE